MDAGFVTSKNRRQQQVHHSRWQSFQFRFDSSTEIVCKQMNFHRKTFVFSRISAEFFSLRDNSANPNTSRICFPAIRILFQIADWGLAQNDRRNERLTDKHHRSHNLGIGGGNCVKCALNTTTKVIYRKAAFDSNVVISLNRSTAFTSYLVVPLRTFFCAIIQRTPNCN